MEDQDVRPRFIRVGALVYQVYYKETMSPYDAWEGLSDHNDMEIWVHDALSPLRQKETLIHEVDHCIQQVYQCGLEQPTEEQQAAARGMGYLQVLRDNSTFVHWITT